MPQLQLVDRLVEAGLPFAAFRLPGKKEEIQVVAQTELKVSSFLLKNIENQKGFVVAPFDSVRSGKAWCIKPEIYIDSPAAARKMSKKLPQQKKISKIANLETTKEEYLNRVEYLVKYLKNSSLDKIVFSRMMNMPLFPGFSLTGLFAALEARYKDAFIFMFSLPENGIWIGATPETFLHLGEETTTTVALAGTCPTDKIDWTDKELEEHKYVSDFITRIFKDQNIKNVVVRGPVTIIAGSVVHLKTIFQVPSGEVKLKVGKLVEALHPTPAVCGLPKKEAFELIKKVEKHERRFYAGFSGPWNLNGNSHLFVNLRCAEVGESDINQYVGGGITVDSDPELEWEETVKKSKTLLSALEKM